MDSQWKSKYTTLAAQTGSWFYSTLLNFIKSGGGRTSSRSERIPQQDRLCLEMCAIPSAHSFIYCVCVQFKHVSMHQYANNFTCHLTSRIVNASHAGSFWVPHKMKEQGEQLLDQIVSASHAVQGPNSSCEQHKKLRGRACHYAINNLQMMEEVPSWIPSVINWLLLSGTTVFIPYAVLDCFM